MPRFYFHVTQHLIRFEDHDGLELPDLKAAWQNALSDARVLVRSGILEGDIYEQRIEVTDDAGTIVATVPLSVALSIH